MHSFRCFISRESISQCPALPNAPGLGWTHRISAPQRICCKCGPASQQRWAIPQTLADQTGEKSYWQCLQKETALCELCHPPALAKPYWTQLSESRSKGKSQHTEEKRENLQLTTTEWLQVIPFYHPRPPRILQGGLGRRNENEYHSYSFNSLCSKELHFVTYTPHKGLKCNQNLSKIGVILKYLTRGVCFLELFKSSAPVRNAHK